MTGCAWRSSPLTAPPSAQIETTVRRWSTSPGSASSSSIRPAASAWWTGSNASREAQRPGGNPEEPRPCAAVVVHAAARPRDGALQVRVAGDHEAHIPPHPAVVGGEGVVGGADLEAPVPVEQPGERRAEALARVAARARAHGEPAGAEHPLAALELGRVHRPEPRGEVLLRLPQEGPARLAGSVLAPRGRAPAGEQVEGAVAVGGGRRAGEQAVARPAPRVVGEAQGDLGELEERPVQARGQRREDARGDRAGGLQQLDEGVRLLDPVDHVHDQARARARLPRGRIPALLERRDDPQERRVIDGAPGVHVVAVDAEHPLPTDGAGVARAVHGDADAAARRGIPAVEARQELLLDLGEADSTSWSPSTSTSSRPSARVKRARARKTGSKAGSSKMAASFRPAPIGSR